MLANGPTMFLIELMDEEAAADTAVQQETGSDESSEVSLSLNQ